MTIAPIARTGTASAPYRRGERPYWLARAGLLIVAIALAGTVVRWPDARRAPVPCAVIGHVPPKGGKNGHDGRVRVRVADTDESFPVVGGFATQSEAAEAFAKWPIGETRTCWKLPYPAREQAVAASGASWLPTLVPLACGIAIAVWANWERRRVRPVVDAGPLRTGHPFRDVADRAPAPPPLSVGAPACTRRQRTAAWLVLAFWSLLFGSFVVLGVTAPTPAGSLLEPGSLARLGTALFAVLGLGIPGGVFFWPAAWALLARRTLLLDAAGGVVGCSVGVPGLRRTRWTDLPRDATLEGDAIAAGAAGAPIAALPRLEPADRRAVERWLDAWRG